MNALEFADMIERYNAGVMSQKNYKDAADELRRLAAVEAELVALKKSLAAAPAAPSEVNMDEYRAMVAAMERIDPATLPGLTAEQRCALSRFAKPAGGLAGNAQPKRRPIASPAHRRSEPRQPCRQTPAQASTTWTTTFHSEGEP